MDSLNSLNSISHVHQAPMCQEKHFGLPCARKALRAPTCQKSTSGSHVPEKHCHTRERFFGRRRQGRPQERLAGFRQPPSGIPIETWERPVLGPHFSLGPHLSRSRHFFRWDGEAHFPCAGVVPTATSGYSICATHFVDPRLPLTVSTISAE